MRDPAEEAGMLEALAEFLAPTQALVTFNGKAFDAPLLITRYTLHNIPFPFKDYAHLDLLPLARRLWRDRLPSRALKYLEENVLSAPRTLEEVPGYEIPYLYFDYLRSRDARPLKGVFYHNAMDVVAMAALLSHVTPSWQIRSASRLNTAWTWWRWRSCMKILGNGIWRRGSSNAAWRWNYPRRISGWLSSGFRTCRNAVVTWRQLSVCGNAQRLKDTSTPMWNWLSITNTSAVIMLKR